jgi:hypothetical protein
MGNDFDGGADLVYKVVEVTPVTDEELEKALNRWTAQGYHFIGIQFAMRESSPRPSLAFVIFVKSEIKDPLPGEE